MTVANERQRLKQIAPRHSLLQLPLPQRLAIGQDAHPRSGDRLIRRAAIDKDSGGKRASESLQGVAAIHEWRPASVPGPAQIRSR